MAKAQEVKERIQSVKSIQQVTRAMKMVADAKLKKAQRAIEQARPYAYKINNVLSQLLPQIGRELNPLLEIRPVETVGLVIITADRGLCGAFNSRIIRRAEQEIEKYAPDQVNLICIGRKGLRYFRRRQYHIIGEYVDFFKGLTFSSATSIAEVITNAFLQNHLDRIDILYNEFKNIIQQEVVIEQFLPLVVEEEAEPESIDEVIFEPNAKAFVDSLIPRHLNVQMWRMLLESNAAEQGARRTAMDNATSNAEDMMKDLQMEYNKARQAAITKEISEIVGGAEAMAE